MLKEVSIFQMLQKQDQDFLMEVYLVMQYVVFGAVRRQLSKDSSLLGPTCHFPAARVTKTQPS